MFSYFKEAIKKFFIKEVSSQELLLRRGIWRSKENIYYNVEDLEDWHLISIIRLLKKNAMVSIRNPFKLNLTFDESECGFDWKDFYDKKAINVLLKEAKKRNIDWENKLWS